MWPEQGCGVLNRAHLPGKLNKKDPWDCGNTQCGICRNDGDTRRYRRERAAVDWELRELTLEDVDGLIHPAVPAG